jgi:hypothetical protein
MDTEAKRSGAARGRRPPGWTAVDDEEGIGGNRTGRIKENGAKIDGFGV